MKQIPSILLCIVALACLAPIACVGEFIPCGVCAEYHTCYDTPGVRINFVNTLLEIDGSDPSFIHHGFTPGSLRPQFEGQAPQGICEYFRSVFTMTLSINGTPISPDWFEIGAEEQDGALEWSPAYYFLFPAGYFDRGVHVLQLVLDLNDVLCELVRNAEEMSLKDWMWIEDGKLFGHLVATITLTVL